jgi:hypothetical protein
MMRSISLALLTLLCACSDEPEQASVRAEPSSVNFGRVPWPELAGRWAEVEGHNTGPTTLRLESASVEGADFVVELPARRELAAGAALSFVLRPEGEAPLRAGRWTARLEVELQSSSEELRRELSVPLTLQLDCDLDGDHDEALLCGGGDCAEDDPQLSSRSMELCDGVDNDCFPSTWHTGLERDADSFRACTCGCIRSCTSSP